MISPAKYYPEFDSVEIKETITPLAEFDTEVADVLRRVAPVGDGSAAEITTGGPEATRNRGELAGGTSSLQLSTSVREWLRRPESYPFQSLVKATAAPLAAPDPTASFPGLFHDPDAATIQLLDRAEARLREAHIRPLVAALNHSRQNQLLTGETSGQRYQYFLNEALRTSFEEVSGLAFPVLKDIVRVVLRNEAASFNELCEQLTADRSAIAARFGIAPEDQVASFGFAEGDAHHHGRSVTIINFRSGKRLVHKPRDVSCEAAYETLVAELNTRLGTNLAAARVLDQSGYGYVEFIQAEDVSDISAEFMRSSGELAAVFYLLNARDMHFENIVPTRRGPVPIDLETILHPERIHEGPTPQAENNAYETIGQSVYGIGILPLVMIGKNGVGGHVDLGFLGDQNQGSSPFKSIQFENAFTDEMTLAFRQGTTQSRSTVLNSLSEEDVHALGARMASGFARVCRTVMSARRSWEALLHSVTSGVRVRYVHNPTALYAQTLRMTTSASALDAYPPYLALLKRMAIAGKTSARQLVRSEMAQLAERDVPYFVVDATDVQVLDGDGTLVGASFTRSPLELALAKVARLTEFEIGEQLRLIYSSFASRFPDNHLTGQAQPTQRKSKDSPGPAVTVRPDRELAALMGDLCDHMVSSSRPDRFAHLPYTWIGPLASAQANRPWPPAVLGYDLYTGRVGPGLALAVAGRVLDEPRYREVAARVFAPTADILFQHSYEVRSVRQAGFAGYTGLAGTLFALYAAGRLLEESDWVSAARNALPLVVEQVLELPPQKTPLDLISGLAGVLSCVNAIGGQHADDATGTLVQRLSGLLLNAGAQPGAENPVLDQSGFAHGVSGLMHALSQAYPRLARDRQDVVETVLSRLYERLGSFFDQEEGNWYSNVVSPGSFSTGWCHGATGIGLALSAYSAVEGGPEVARTRDLAVANIVRLGFGRNLTWCHGDLGNHDALRAISQESDVTVGGVALREKLAGIERRWLQPGVFLSKFHDRTSRYAHTNSLMVGSAGIVTHLANRLDPTLRVSPLTLTVEGC